MTDRRFPNPSRVKPSATLHVVCMLTGAAAMGACSGNASNASLPGDDHILAQADDVMVTGYDLEAYLLATLGDFGAMRIDEAGRKKALEGLVATKIIARQREQELSLEQRAELDKKVEAYREQLLLKQYLAVHAPPEPVTAEQIRTYYAENPDRFAARSDRSFEMLFTPESLPDAKQRQLLDLLGKIDDQDWAARAASLRARGMPVHHRRGVVDRAPLHPRLEKALRNMRLGRPSAPIFVQDKLYVLRVTSEKQHPARSLHEASGEIRERLVPLQVKKAIAKARSEAMRGLHVTYP